MNGTRVVTFALLSSSVLSVAGAAPVLGEAQKTKFQKHYCTANEKVGFVWKKKVVRPGKDLIRELDKTELSPKTLDPLKNAAMNSVPNPKLISARVWEIKEGPKNKHWLIASLEMDGQETSALGPVYSFCKVALVWSADSDAPQTIYAPCVKSAEPRSDTNPRHTPPILQPFDLQDFNADGKDDVVIQELGSHGGAFRLYSPEKEKWTLLATQCESSD